jgi:TonB dependent receptor-like, beta-barrel
LLTLSPGVTPGAFASVQTRPVLTSSRGTTAVQINGQNDLSTNFLLDGIDNNETTIGGIIIFPPVDALQEFKVQTAASAADFGRNGGGQVNVTLKSGTNEFHGNVFEFFRNDSLDAKNFFDLPDAPKPPFRLNQFGLTAGGPIRKDRTFFFGDYQGSRIRQAQTFTLTVPTARMRNGDFSELGRPVFDPATYDLATNTRRQFPGDVIPPSRFSGAAQLLTQIQYPMPNRPGIGNNFTFTPNRPSDTDAFDIKVDHRLTTKDNFFTRYSFSDFDVGETFFASTVLPNTLFGNTKALDTDPTKIRNQSLAISDKHTFSSKLINEFRFGYTRFNEFSPNRLQDIKAAELVGIAGINNPNFAFTNGLPQIGISGFSTIGEVSFLPFISRINTFQYIDNLIYIKGSHTLKFGIDVRRRHFNFLQPPSQRGNFSFTGVFTNDPAAPAGTGSGFADFLLGLPQVSSQEVKHNSFTGQRSTEWGWYVADTWRLTPKLTLDMGLRYELTTPRKEVVDRQSNFDPTVPGGAFRVASPDALCGRALRCINTTDFAPRFGIAYRLDNTTVLRTSYGIFHDVTGFNGYQGTIFSLFQNPPFTVGQNIINSATDPRNRLEDGFPLLGAVPTVNGLVFPDAVPGFIFSGRFQEPHLKMTAVQQWHLTLERELMQDFLFGASYVGSKGTRILQNLGINDPVPGPGAIAPRRPFPGFANINGQSASGSSSYHSLQLRAQKRYSQGLSFLTSYTWSKVLADVFGLGGSRAQDFRNRRAERGPTSFDFTNRFVFSYNYDLPFGRGRHLGQGAGALSKLVQGWQFGGIVNFQSGEPFSVTLATPVSNTASFNRPHRICDGKLSKRTVERWFDTSCFVTQPLLTFGNSGVGILRGPGTKQLDWSLLKNTHIDEQRYVQFRAEFFNVFNTPQFNNPNSSLGSPAFGLISGAGEKVNFLRTSRQIQFALKVFW